MSAIQPQPHRLLTPADAEALAARLTAEDTEGWTYKANHDPTGRGHSFVTAIDDEGYEVGRL